MSETKMLFESCVPEEKLHPSFLQMLSFSTSEPARWMMERTFESYRDVDGNFIQQFQTTGFNARFFELYLFAYLTKSGFEVEQRGAPDFLATKDGVTIAIEATTTNPSTSGPLVDGFKSRDELNEKELLDYIKNEFPIRLGSALFSKLNKRYWELDRCKGKPIVIAIEAFHDEESLELADSALARYLYDIDQSAEFSDAEGLDISTRKVKGHSARGKEIPSGFFFQEGAENISAVIFSNSGTHAKFNRMGYQHGIGNDHLHMGRVGFCANPDPSAMDPSYFSYDMDEPPFVETWGQGLSVFHNPKCKFPLPPDFLTASQNHKFSQEQFVTHCSGWHPFSSTTSVVDTGSFKGEVSKYPLRTATVAIGAISRGDFEQIVPL